MVHIAERMNVWNNYGFHYVDCNCMCSFMVILLYSYMVVIHPLSRRLSGGRALAVIVIIWVVSTSIAAPNLAHADVYTWHFDDGSTRTVCFIDWPHEQSDLMCVVRLFRAFKKMIEMLITVLEEKHQHLSKPELVMGHFFKTQPNPTQNFWTQPNPQKSSPNPTQPIIDTWYGILGLGYTENFIPRYNNCYTSQTS